MLFVSNKIDLLELWLSLLDSNNVAVTGALPRYGGTPMELQKPGNSARPRPEVIEVIEIAKG